MEVASPKGVTALCWNPVNSSLTYITHIHIYIHTYTHIHTYRYIHTYIHTYIHQTTSTWDTRYNALAYKHTNLPPPVLDGIGSLPTVLQMMMMMMMMMMTHLSLLYHSQQLLLAVIIDYYELHVLISQHSSWLYIVTRRNSICSNGPIHISSGGCKSA